MSDRVSVVVVSTDNTETAELVHAELLRLTGTRPGDGVVEPSVSPSASVNVVTATVFGAFTEEQLRAVLARCTEGRTGHGDIVARTVGLSAMLGHGA